MEKQEQIEARSKMKSVTVGALAANIVLFGLKLTVGILAGSESLTSHTHTDMEGQRPLPHFLYHCFCWLLVWV